MMNLLWVVIGAVLIALIILEFNKLIELRNKTKQSKSTIDVYLNQRFDLIPNLIECVKAYMQHESDLLANLSIMRIRYFKEKDLKQGAELTHEFNKVMAIGENYPDLKASEQFLSLQKSLIKIESQLQAARRVYNGDVTLYNTTISSFPTIIIAKIFGFKEAELFEIEEYKKQNIDVEL